MHMTDHSNARFLLVTICVCTYKRPHLRECLESLAKQNLPGNIDVNIVVTDNCPEHSAKGIVDTFSHAYRIDVDYQPFSARNLSRVRNHSLSAATGEFIALIDDDQVASSDWLKQLIDCSNHYSADVVIGPVFNTYSATCPSWIAEADLMARLAPTTGKKLKTGHAGNALIRRSTLEKSHIVFDERLGGSGGEDTDFFYRLHKQGAIIIGCQEAIAYEVIDPSRENWQYLLHENKRTGQVFSRAIWPLLSTNQRIIAIASLLAKVVIFGLGFILTYPFGLRFYALWQLLCIRNIEKIRYLVKKDQTISPYCR